MIVLLLIVLGLTLGSFVNALVWRIHYRKNWINDRSECVHCHHKLGVLDLIPVISWLWLRGRCRYCHKKIDDSPLTELILPLFFVVSYLLWPVELQGAGLIEFGFWLVFLVGFLALAVYDLRWFLLPDKLVFPLAALAAVQVITIAVWSRDWHVLIAATGGVLVISGLFYILFQLSQGAWIGGGDVKLGLAIGPLAGGVLEAFLLLFVASLIGVVCALPLIIKGEATRKTQLPFGPLLIAGLVVVKLFGAAVISWYTGLLHV